jgi:hypothetical protein
LTSVTSSPKGASGGQSVSTKELFNISMNVPCVVDLNSGMRLCVLRCGGGKKN